MSEEEKEAVEILKNFMNGKIERDKLETIKGSYKIGYFYMKDIQNHINIILNLIKRQRQEIKLKDKIINNMAEWIYDEDYGKNSLGIDRDSDYYSNMLKEVEEIFTNKAKEEINE